MKNLPYDKTVVLELKVTLADLMSRNVALKSSVASAIPLTDTYNSGDTTATQEVPLQITDAKNCLILSSFADFLVIVRGETEDIALPCKGLFIHNGPIEKVWVKPPVGVDAVRVQYIWS